MDSLGGPGKSLALPCLSVPPQALSMFFPPLCPVLICGGLTISVPIFLSVCLSRVSFSACLAASPLPPPASSLCLPISLPCLLSSCSTPLCLLCLLSLLYVGLLLSLPSSLCSPSASIHSIHIPASSSLSLPSSLLSSFSSLPLTPAFLFSPFSPIPSGYFCWWL